MLKYTNVMSDGVEMSFPNLMVNQIEISISYPRPTSTEIMNSDSAVEIIVQRFPKISKMGDRLCEDCYESLGAIGLARPRVPRVSRLKLSGKRCPGCRTLLEFFQAAQNQCQSARPVSFSNPATIRRSWAYWVNDYSRIRRLMTEDEATALLGLITFVQVLKRDELLLGLWKDNIAEDLLWERGIWDYPAGRKRVASFPSWTWMSLPGAVQYTNFSLATTEIELIRPRISWSDQPFKSSLAIAELLLWGKLFKGTLTYRGGDAHRSSLYLNMGSSRVKLFERLDIPDSHYKKTSVQLILIGGTAMHWFFLITSVGNSKGKSHTRIGRAYSPWDPASDTFEKLEDYFDMVEPQMITLR